MGFNEATRNAILDGVLRNVGVFAGGAGETVTHISLHTADPGETGLNEVSGGSYAPQSITWTDPSTGTAAESDNNAEILFSDMPATTVTHIGFWTGSDTATATFRGGGAVTTSRDFLAGDDAKIAAGGLVKRLTVS